MNYAAAAVIGLIGGVCSGLFGVGGGVVMVPAMLWLMRDGISSTHQAIGTSLAVIVPTALIGVAKHHQLGNVKWGVAALLVPTALFGGWLGARLTSEISSTNLKRGFGGFLLLVALRLLFSR